MYSEKPEHSHAPSLIMIDIDNFKQVNDTYGHHEGDIVLKTLSEVMTDTCKAKDPNISIGRWGGEEFMILIPSPLDFDVEELAEELRNAFKDVVFEVSGSHTISLGVTTAIVGEHVDTLCSRVDNALYEAKRAGKDRVVVK